MYLMKFFIHTAGETETFVVDECKYFSMSEATAMAQTIAMVLNDYCQIECSYLIMKEKENNIPEPEDDWMEEKDEEEDEDELNHDEMARVLASFQCARSSLNEMLSKYLTEGP